MILSQLKQFMITRRQATLSDIALHFHTDPDAMRGMLDVWIRKGKMSRHVATASCGTSCHRCGADATEIYIWHGSGQSHFVAQPSRCQTN